MCNCLLLYSTVAGYPQGFDLVVGSDIILSSFDLDLHGCSGRGSSILLVAVAEAVTTLVKNGRKVLGRALIRVQ